MWKVQEMNNNPIQTECKQIGSTGCYFLSIFHALSGYCEKHGIKVAHSDIIHIYEVAVANGWMDPDCYVKAAGLLAAYIIGANTESEMIQYAKNPDSYKKITVRHEPLSYQPKENEIEITRYELANTGTVFVHFVETRDSKVIYDPYKNSSAVAKGNPVTKRIIAINF